MQCCDHWQRRSAHAVRAVTTLPPLDARASTDVVVRVMDSDRVKLERAGVVRLEGVATPTRDVPECYNREPGVKARAMLPRGTKVNVEDVNGDADVVAGGKSVSETLVRKVEALRDAKTTARLRRGRLPGFRRSPRLKRPRSATSGLWRPCDATRAGIRSRPSMI